MEAMLCDLFSEKLSDTIKFVENGYCSKRKGTASCIITSKLFLKATMSY